MHAVAEFWIIAKQHEDDNDGECRKFKNARKILSHVIL